MGQNVLSASLHFKGEPIRYEQAILSVANWDSSIKILAYPTKTVENAKNQDKIEVMFRHIFLQFV
jgi:hypothetical protein